MTCMETVPSDLKYKVIIQGGGVYDAEFMGADLYSNLIFLKINSSNLPVISFGNSADSTPGEKIVAIGSSSETFANRYTAGLISTFDPTFSLSGKAISYSDKMNGVFQTDFSIDSEQYYTGGPVVDYTGQVIGIAGSNQKDFFFIPSNKVTKVVDKAIKKELANNVYLGIYYIPITKAYALSNNLKVESGALIFSSAGQEGLAIIAGSNGQRAGLKLDDIIIAVNDEKISLENDLSDLLYQYKKGDKVILTVLRNDQETKIEVQF
jgi:serine protease Do